MIMALFKKEKKPELTDEQLSARMAKGGGMQGYIKRNNIDLSDKRQDLPVGYPCAGIVPMRGNVHAALNRIVSRKEIDKRLKKLKHL